MSNGYRFSILRWVNFKIEKKSRLLQLLFNKKDELKLELNHTLKPVFKVTDPVDIEGR